MDTNSRLEIATKLLAPWAKESTMPEANRQDVKIESGDLLPAIKSLGEAKWGFLTAITGLDRGGEPGELEVLYHFCSGAAVLSLRVRTPRTNGSVPSICTLIPSAILFERELKEMFGVAVDGMTDDEHLFLPEDWQEGIYPLRKDYKYDQTGIA